MKTLLFADDSKNIREFCKQVLEDEGYRVILARDGAEAIHLVQTEHPDLAILDLCMPRASGLEAVERISALPTDPSRLFSSPPTMTTASPTIAVVLPRPVWRRVKTWKN